MNITIEKAEKNSLTFAYIWSGEPNQSPPVKSFHTSFDGDEGKAIVEQQAKDWLAAQQCVQLTCATCGGSGERMYLGEKIGCEVCHGTGTRN